MSEVVYKPTLDNIRLTAEQEKIMDQMMRHVHEDDVPALKLITRWQFWFRFLWDSGKKEGEQAAAQKHDVVLQCPHCRCPVDPKTALEYEGAEDL